jgi:hypothetical protein
MLPVVQVAEHRRIVMDLQFELTQANARIPAAPAEVSTGRCVKSSSTQHPQRGRHGGRVTSESLAIFGQVVELKGQIVELEQKLAEKSEKKAHAAKARVRSVIEASLHA